MATRIVAPGGASTHPQTAQDVQLRCIPEIHHEYDEPHLLANQAATVLEMLATHSNAPAVAPALRYLAETATADFDAAVEFGSDDARRSAEQKAASLIALIDELDLTDRFAGNALWGVRSLMQMACEQLEQHRHARANVGGDAA